MRHGRAGIHRTAGVLAAGAVVAAGRGGRNGRCTLCTGERGGGRACPVAGDSADDGGVAGAGCPVWPAAGARVPAAVATRLSPPRPGGGSHARVERINVGAVVSFIDEVAFGNGALWRRKRVWTLVRGISCATERDIDGDGGPCSSRSVSASSAFVNATFPPLGIGTRYSCEPRPHSRAHIPSRFLR